MDRKSTKFDNARADRTKKRKFTGNRHTYENNTTPTSASAAKFAKNDADFEVNVDQSVRYCIINFALFLTLQQILICKTCKKDIKFSKRAEKGLGFQLSVQCGCEDDTYIPSSPQVHNSYEINRRFVFAMRMLGVGLQGIVNFLGLMDIGKGFTKSAYYKIVDHIWIAASAVAQKVFQKAAREEQEKNESDVKNHLSVSGDGTWAKRGFSSLIGVTSLIGKFTGKIIDLIVKSSICKACEKWADKEDTVEYDAWYETHAEECSANHEGSAEMMEVNSIIEMFKRSVEFFKVYYKYYIGDGDTKTFKLLQEEEPYRDVLKVEKKECVLHVKKRMYKRAKDAKKQLTQLKKAKKNLEEKKSKETAPKKKTVVSTKKKTAIKTPKSTSKVKEEKTVSLTNKVMQDLSLYYGLAVLRNKDSIEDMKKSIWATFYHKISTDANPQHTHCPAGAESWCKYRKAEAAGTLKDYKHPPALDKDIQELLKPIYEDLSSDDLLQRCVGANTQNSNESYNACIWQLAPKHVFAGKKIVEIAAYCAACTYNEGFQPLLKIMETMGISVGEEAVNLARRQDAARISQANRRSNEYSKEHRVALRNARLEENQIFEEAEGVIYGAGIAD